MLGLHMNKFPSHTVVTPVPELSPRAKPLVDHLFRCVLTLSSPVKPHGMRPSFYLVCCLEAYEVGHSLPDSELLEPARINNFLPLPNGERMTENN